MSESMDYSALLDGIRGAAYVSDEEGGIVGWNSAAEDLVGYEKDTVVGSPCHQIIRGRDSSGNRFCRRACDLRQLMRRGEFCTIQLAVRKASGAYVPVTCWAVALCEESHCNSFQILHVLAPRRSEQTSTRAPEAVRDRGFSSAAAASTADDAAILTHREAEVLKLLAGGRTTHEVAAALSMSVNTIRTHTQNVLRKLNTRTRLRAAAAEPPQCFAKLRNSFPTV